MSNFNFKAFEENLVAGALYAKKVHLLSHGEWLSDSNESFLQYAVLFHVHKKQKNISIGAEVSRAALKNYSGERRGRKNENKNKRFDIGVYPMGPNKFHAVVEIKSMPSVGSVVKDGEKLRAIVKKGNHRAKKGYLLIYDEDCDRKNMMSDSKEPLKRKAALKRRFATYQEKLNKDHPKKQFELVASKIACPRDAKENGRLWAWGIALFRLSV